MYKLLLVILCFFFPFIAVWIKEGFSGRVVLAFVLQLLGHIPGVIYGLWRVLKD